MTGVNVRYIPFLTAAFVILSALPVAACSRLFGSRPSLTAVPELSEVGPDASTPLPDVCYVFIMHHAEQLGGIPALMEITYVSNDGLVQQTRDRTDDIVLSLRQGNANVAEFLKLVGSAEFAPSATEVSECLPPPPVLPEYVGPSIYVEIGRCGAVPSTWLGDPEGVPTALREIIEAADQLGRTMPSQTLQTGERYIRSQPLLPEKVEPFGRAGLVVEISPEQLATAPLLRSALQFSRRLIHIPTGEAPYGAIPLAFAKGRSTHIACGGRVFQIRHLVAETQ